MSIQTSFMSRRRRVDWPILLGPPGRELPHPKVVDRAIRGQLSTLLAAFDEILAIEDRDAILRRSVEVAREKVGLARAAIFLLDASRDMMLGTWGTDLDGTIVDEHRIMYALTETDREAFRRVQDAGVHFTIFDDCPIVEHRGLQSRVAGRGWGAWTPIIASHGPIGMLFNDAGLTGAPVDETKQLHAALLCSLLGAVLDPARGVPGAGKGGAGETKGRRLVTAAAAILTENPSIDARVIARRLEVSVGWLARVFKADMGMSLVEYRNRVRLDRVDALLDGNKKTLLESALAAGFGSYAQFHRVFRSVRHMTPREYMRRNR